MEYFDYPETHQAFELKLVKSSRQWRHHAVSFPTALPTSYPEIGTACGEYFEPAAKEAPLVILLHGMGDQSLIPCKLLAAALVQPGHRGLRPVSADTYPPVVRGYEAPLSPLHR